MEMKKIISQMPSQFKTGLASAKAIRIKGKFENIIVPGMGGSALPVEVLRAWGIKTKIPVISHRGYGLPFCAGKKSLIIPISYSGNTEETVSALKEALKRKLKTAIITSSGKLEKIAKKNNLPLAKIPLGIPPRLAIGYQFSALFSILKNSKIVEGNKEKEIILLKNELEKIANGLEKEGKSIAKKLKGKIILVYASNQFKQLAKIWKISFNENAKTPAFYNYFPELNHNEMVGFEGGMNRYFKIIILESGNDEKRIKKRISLFVKIAKKKKIGIFSVKIKEGSPLFRVFSTIILGNWSSYYLALENKVKPGPVKIVEEFKKELNATS